MSWDEVLDTMTFSRIRALRKRHEECPPMDRLLAAYIGWKKPEPKQYMTAEAARDFMRLTDGRIPGMSTIHAPR